MLFQDTFFQPRRQGPCLQSWFPILREATLTPQSLRNLITHNRVLICPRSNLCHLYSLYLRCNLSKHEISRWTINQYLQPTVLLHRRYHNLMKNNRSMYSIVGTSCPVQHAARMWPRPWLFAGRLADIRPHYMQCARVRHTRQRRWRQPEGTGAHAEKAKTGQATRYPGARCQTGDGPLGWTPEIDAGDSVWLSEKTPRWQLV